MSELLVELRAEVLPQLPNPGVVAMLRDLMIAELRSVGLAPRQAGVGCTCRRLVLVVRGVSRTSGADPAKRRSDAGRAVTRAIEGLAWPDQRGLGFWWRRCGFSLVAILDGEAAEAEPFGHRSSKSTAGHPTRSTQEFEVQDSADYRRQLESRGIEVRFGERRSRLREALSSAAGSLNAELNDDPALLEELTAACEEVGVVSCQLPENALELPRELVIVTLRARLRAFTLVREKRLAPAFLATMDRGSDPEGWVRRGYEWSARALFDDVAFFYRRDLERPLAERARILESELVDEELPMLGTHAERARRLGVLASALCTELHWEGELDRVQEAISILDADAHTGLVQEFPELRGIHGGLLARENGYAEPVWKALADHASSETGRSMMPRSRCGAVVALASWTDRVAASLLARSDTSTELAESIVNIILQRRLPIDLRLLAARAVRAFEPSETDQREAATELGRQLDKTLVSLLEREGFNSEEVHATRAAAASSLPIQIVQRLRGLGELRRDQTMASHLDRLVVTARRLSSILDGADEEELDIQQLAADAEKDLFVVLQRCRRESWDMGRGQSAVDWLSHMLDLDRVVQRFLAELLVRDDDAEPRRNRIALLQQVAQLYSEQIELRLLSVVGSDRGEGARR